MMNTPTNRLTPANTSRKGVEEPDRRDRRRVLGAYPRRDRLGPCGSTAATRSPQGGLADAVARASHGDRSTVPSGANQRARPSRGRRRRSWPRGPPSKDDLADDRHRLHRAGHDELSRVADRKPGLLKRWCPSTTTSPAPGGGPWPATSGSAGRRAGSRRPSAGRPPFADGGAVTSDEDGGRPPGRGGAGVTPSTRRAGRRATSAAGVRRSPLVGTAVDHGRGQRRRPGPSRSSKMLSNVDCRLSVSTKRAGDEGDAEHDRRAR